MQSFDAGAITLDGANTVNFRRLLKFGFVFSSTFVFLLGARSQSRGPPWALRKYDKM